MTTARYDFNFDQGSTESITFDYTSGDVGIDLSGYSAEMQIRRSYTDTKIVCLLNDSYPNGCFGPGLTGPSFVAGSGITLGTGGIQLNYNGVTGSIRLVIDKETTFSAFTDSRLFYDFELSTGGVVTKVLSGKINVGRAVQGDTRVAASFIGTPGVSGAAG